MQVIDMIITGDDIDGISILKTELAKLWNEGFRLSSIFPRYWSSLLT
jgi:hypothetical protein